MPADFEHGHRSTLESANIGLLSNLGTLRAIYPSPPGEDLIAAFRRHVAQTGQPETFPTISTCRPPQDGTVEVLFHPVDLNRKTRPDKDEAPCAICSIDAPKWLHKGSLIWCDASQAIYAVGPGCSETLWKDGRMNRALNLFMEGERAKKDGMDLFHLARRAPRLLEWIDAHRLAARRAGAAHADLAKSARHMRRALALALKPDGFARDRGFLADKMIGHVPGSAFLAGGWSLEADLDKAAAVLRQIPTGTEQELLAWIDGLAPSVRAKRLAEVKASREALIKVANRVHTASTFLMEHTIDVLVRWSKCENPPINFTIVRTGSRVEFRHKDEVWRGPLGYFAVEPVP